jgi:uncharacterized protein YkwD
MKSIILSLLLIWPVLLSAKPEANPNTKTPIEATTWTREELAMANTAKDVDYLSDEEKKIIFYMNLARMDGTRFFNTYFQTFVDSHNLKMRQYSNYKELKVNRYDAYYRGLEQDLRRAKNLGILYPDETLTYVSDQHGKDMNKHNMVGHVSSDGRTMVNRIEKYYKDRGMAENLAFGFAGGLENVCMLLLDTGIPDVGHRKNILNTSLGLNLVGVSIQPHPHYKYSATIDFVAVPNVKPKN